MQLQRKTYPGVLESRCETSEHGTRSKTFAYQVDSQLDGVKKQVDSKAAGSLLLWSVRMIMRYIMIVDHVKICTAHAQVCTSVYAPCVRVRVYGSMITM